MKNLIFMLLLAGSIGGVYAQNAEKKDKFSPRALKKFPCSFLKN